MFLSLCFCPFPWSINISFDNLFTLQEFGDRINVNYTTVGFIGVIFTIVGHPVASIIPIDAGTVAALEFLRRASGIYNT